MCTLGPAVLDPTHVPVSLEFAKELLRARGIVEWCAEREGAAPAAAPAAGSA